MSALTIQWTSRTKKFTFQGMSALGHTSLTQTLTLSLREIMQVARAFNSGSLTEMIRDTRQIMQVGSGDSEVEQFFSGVEPPMAVAAPAVLPVAPAVLPVAVPVAPAVLPVTTPVVVPVQAVDSSTAGEIVYCTALTALGNRCSRKAVECSLCAQHLKKK